MTVKDFRKIFCGWVTIYSTKGQIICNDIFLKDNIATDFDNYKVMEFEYDWDEKGVYFDLTIEY